MVNNVGYSDSNFINLKSERNNQNWQAGIGLKEVKSIDGLHKTIRDYLAKQFSQFIRISSNYIWS